VTQRIFTGLSGVFLLLSYFTHIHVWEILAVICGMWYVLPRVLRSFHTFTFDMHLLMGIAVLGALILHQWSEAATVAFLFSLSLVLESWSVQRADHAMTALMTLAPQNAYVVQPLRGHLPVEDVVIGNIILVRPGEKVPLDGQVVQGTSWVDESMLTGESKPIFKQAGDRLFAGTLNHEGTLECCVTTTTDTTRLARIRTLVIEARQQRSGSELWVDSFAKVYTPIMLCFSILTALIPPLFLGQPWIEWLYRGLVVLVIACPCALVIATPVAIVSGITLAASRGILIKRGIFLEEIGRIKALAFDKTGTLTYGKPVVQRIIPFHGHTEQELMERAVALEQNSTHPLARAILNYGIPASMERATHFQEIKGKGAQAIYKGRLFWIGSHRFMHEVGQETPEMHQLVCQLEDAGHSVVALGNEDHVCGVISIADAPREGLYDILQQLKAAGVEKLVMLTGDNAPTAQALAQVLGIESMSELLPEDKMHAVMYLKNTWKKVGMVGDGVNDAPAMAIATLAIAMGGQSSDVALETSDITLMKDDLRQLPWLMHYSRRVLRVVKQNITFALSLKLLFVMLALSQLATLWMAIAADTGATLLVIFNALRLLKD